MKKIVFSISCVLMSTNLIAGTLTCNNVKVNKVAYHGTNKLMVQLSNMNYPVFFCNPDGQWSVPGTSYVMGPETCKSVFSMFLSAKVSGAVLTRVHFDGDDVPATCDSWEPWKSAVIRYVNF